MTVPKSIDQTSYDSFAHESEEGGNQQPKSKGGLRKSLTPVQFGLLIAVGLLVFAVQILILRTYFNSTNTADEFKEASFLFTSLADIQREVLLLQLETNKILHDQNPDIKSLSLRRALLANQLRLQSNQSSDKPRITLALREIQSSLDQYDAMLATFAKEDMSMDFIEPAEVDEVLSGLELQTKTLYDREEQVFFEAFKTTLNTQRVSQVLLLTVDGLVLVLGVVLVVSLTRTVRALNAENAVRKNAEEALINANETLERRVDERTSELSSANDRLQQEVFERALAQRELRAFAGKLEQSNHELESFASIAAHDLQEPLRKVQAFGDRLKTKFADELGEQGRDYLIRMQDASGRMATLINDLLAYSRVTTKAQPFVKLDLAQIASEVVSDLEIRIEELNGRVELGELPSIDAEPLQMRQLIQNLIGNALKYHKENVPPVVTVSAQIIDDRQAQSEKSCQITVKDNGIGFDEKYSDRIFGIFQRLHTRNDYEGTGVGLAICKKIVERHNGKIVANSTLDEGSTFIVTLPVKQKAEQSEEL